RHEPSGGAPGNIHAPIKWGRRIVVGPTRFAIVISGGVNAKMSPAGSVRGSRGLVPTETLRAAQCIKPDCEPGAAWFVVQSNGVALGTGEGALTAGSDEAGVGGAPIGR